MIIIDESVLIEASQAHVFEVSQSTGLRASWDPFTSSIDYEGGSAPGRGVVARVLARNGLAVRVRYIKFDPPERAAIVMLQGPAFLSSFAGSWIFEPISAHQTLVRFRYSLTAWPWLQRLCVWQYRRDVCRRLRGLKSYCESLTQKTSRAMQLSVKTCQGENHDRRSGV